MTDTNPPVGATVVDGFGVAWTCVSVATNRLWESTTGITRFVEHAKDTTALWRMQRDRDELQTKLDAVDAACLEVCCDNDEATVGADGVDSQMGRYLCLGESGDPIIEEDEPAEVIRRLNRAWGLMQERAEQAEAALREASEREARARPTLADVWAAYEAGVGSGQRHPDADASLISKSADAYVKSIWDFDPTTGALTRPAEAELEKLRALAVEAKALLATESYRTAKQPAAHLLFRLAALATPNQEPTP